jgi:hypothetical protein
MNKAELLTETIGTYTRHGWQLRRLLLTTETQNVLSKNEPPAPITDASVDAVWFSRPSRGDREAWELRLLENTPYALFENFEPDETEEQREEMRREMEARLVDYVGKS